MASMDWDDYLRHEAAMYRQLAEKSENVFGKQELLDLAAVCEEVANNIEVRATMQGRARHGPAEVHIAKVLPKPLPPAGSHHFEPPPPRGS